MAEILGLGCTHWPVLTMPDDKLTGTFKKTLASPACPPHMKDPSHWPPSLVEEWGSDQGLAAAQLYSARLADDFRRVRQELDRFEPDLVLIWGDDQYENFREDIVPPFCLLGYEDMVLKPWDAGGHTLPNRWGEPAQFEFPVRGAREAARQLATGLIERGIDMAYAYEPLHEPELSHAFIKTLLFLDWDRKGFPYPVLPMAVNCYGRSLFKAKGGLAALYESSEQRSRSNDPPGPQPWRCMDVGRAIAEHFAESTLRVALIASASWSHAFLSPRFGFLLPDLSADKRLFDALCRRDYDTWRKTPAQEMEAAGQHEVLNWMLLAGAMEYLGHEPQVIDYVESHLFTSQKCFMAFR